MKTMTRFFSLGALLLAAAGFSACSSDSDTVIDQPEVTPAPKTYSVSIEAAKGDDGSISRALSLDGDNNLTSAWAEGEEVTVYNITQSAELGGKLKAQAAGANTTLAGTLTGNIAAGDELLLKFCSDSYNSQNGTLEYISQNCDYATATVTVDKVTGSAFVVNSTAEFKNQQAIIKFTLKDKGNSDALINPSAFTITDGTSTVELSDIPASTYTTNGDGVLFVAFPAAGEPKTITLFATVGDKTYTYKKADVTFNNAEFWTIPVKMSVYIPDANGHESVDLGFTVNGKKILWATKNVGADSESDFGDYFAFGATEPWYSSITPKNSSEPTFTWKTNKSGGYKLANAPLYSNGSYSNYTTGNAVLKAEHDAANKNMGGDWRMPTHEEWVALTDNCTWDWQEEGNSTFGGVAGYKVTSKADSSKFIFLPAAGYCSGTKLYRGGSNGLYWSAMVSSVTNNSWAWNMLFDTSGLYQDNYRYRYIGLTVRGVLRQ